MNNILKYIRGLQKHMALNLKNTTFSYYYKDCFCPRNLEASFIRLFCSLHRNSTRPIIFLCIGTDRIMGDSLGPLTGTKLQTIMPSASLYGTLERPIHGANLPATLELIKENFCDPFIIVVDACLGRPERIGFINIQKGSLKPGSAYKKSLISIGDFHITGVVNVAGDFIYMALQNTRLYLIDRMADLIARSLCTAYFHYRRSQPK